MVTSERLRRAICGLRLRGVANLENMDRYLRAGWAPRLVVHSDERTAERISGQMGCYISRPGSGGYHDQ